MTALHCLAQNKASIITSPSHVSKEPERAELKHFPEYTGMKQEYLMYIPRY